MANLLRVSPERIGSGFEHRVMLTSDHHLGAATTDEARIVKDLERARKENARIIVNGDVFDFILPGDRKRFQQSALADWLHGKDDIVNACIQRAYDLYAPYADLIDVIGDGNHDTALSKHHAADAVALLVQLLNERTSSNILHGGYRGWITYRWYVSTTATVNLKLYRHHGAGGGAPATRGMLDLTRMIGFVPMADVVTVGHKHHRWAAKYGYLQLLDSGREVESEGLFVMTGAYMDTYAPKGNYAANWNISPMPKGGVMVTARLKRNNKEGRDFVCSADV